MRCGLDLWVDARHAGESIRSGGDSVVGGCSVIVGYTRTERTVYDIDDPSYGKLDEAGCWTGPRRL